MAVCLDFEPKQSGHMQGVSRAIFQSRILLLKVVLICVGQKTQIGYVANLRALTTKCSDHSLFNRLVQKLQL